MKEIKVGQKYRFSYGHYAEPQSHSLHLDYDHHRNQTVTVLRPLTKAEIGNPEVSAMFKIEAADGWTGDAFPEELEK